MKCISDDGGDMFYVSKEIFNSIMKRYRCVLDKCGKLIEERIRYYTLQLNKYKENFIKNVEYINNNTSSKRCIKKSNGIYHRSSM